MVEKIVLTPGPNRGAIAATLYGELSTILNWTEHQAFGKSTKEHSRSGAHGSVGIGWLRGWDIQPRQPLEQLTAEDWRHVINLDAVFSSVRLLPGA